jgi:hypothetical protein
MKRVFGKICIVGCLVVFLGAIGTLVGSIYGEKVDFSWKSGLALDSLQTEKDGMLRSLRSGTGEAGRNVELIHSEISRSFWAAENRHPELCGWLIGEVLAGERIERISDRLKTWIYRIDAHPAHRSRLSASALKSGIQALDDWARDSTRFSPKSEGRLLAEGRFSFFEAAGYQKLSRDVDSTVHYLKAREKLELFIKSHPDSSYIPEVLYLLGASYYGLSYGSLERESVGLIPGHKAGRGIMMLVPRYFPNTPWAEKVNAIWMRGAESGSFYHVAL